MDQGRGLQCVVRRLLRHLGRSQTAQLPVHQRQKLVSRRWIALFDLRKDLRNILHDLQDSMQESLLRGDCAAGLFEATAACQKGGAMEHDLTPKNAPSSGLEPSTRSRRKCVWDSD